MVESNLTAQERAKVIAGQSSFKLPGLRWWIIGLIFFATLINYIDRLTISVLAPVITRELGLSNLEFASIGTWFLLAYTISQGLSGRLYDRIGTRRGFTVSVVIWSLAAIAHAFAQGLRSLSAFRFILGLGEAGNWPGAAKTVAEWFPVKERALGMAIFNSGAAIGSVVSPPLIYWLTSRFGWQATFIITGSLGFVWLIAWLIFYQRPDQHPWLTHEERAYIIEGQHKAEEVSVNNATQPSKTSWFSLLRYKQVWAIVIARLMVDPIWWLYMFWLPLYLANARGFNLKSIALFAWVPYAAADAGSLLGGWLSGYLISRGWSVNNARKTLIAGSSLLMPAGIWAAFVADPIAALGLISLVLFGFQVWINNVQTLPSDLFADESIASVAGLGGTGAGIGAMIFTLTTGWVVDNFSYVPILVAAGLLAPIGTTILFMFLGQIQRINLDS